MSLATTLNVAQSALATNAALSSIVSRNIAGVNDPNYSRKTGELSTGPTGAGTLTGTSRATDLALFANLISANADAASGQALADGLNQLEQTVNLTSTSAGDNAPASAIATLTNALQSYAASPSDTESAQAVLTSAKALASNLNTASASVQGVRTQADKAMAASVSTINSLLDQFSGINATIIKGTVSGADVTDALDARDKLLKSLSQEIGISTVPAPNGGMAIYTDSGATLFQGTPRAVAFTPTATFTAGTSGGAVSVDGVPVTGPNAVMAIRSGKLAGLVQLRDVATVNYQNQLDQIAGGLITAFAELGSDRRFGSDRARAVHLFGCALDAGARPGRTCGEHCRQSCGGPLAGGYDHAVAGRRDRGWRESGLYGEHDRRGQLFGLHHGSAWQARHQAKLRRGKRRHRARDLGGVCKLFGQLAGGLAPECHQHGR